jgi:hypothetical protein
MKNFSDQYRDGKGRLPWPLSPDQRLVRAIVVVKALKSPQLGQPAIQVGKRSETPRYGPPNLHGDSGFPIVPKNSPPKKLALPWPKTSIR